MKSNNSSGCSGFVILGIVGLIISFTEIPQQLWDFEKYLVNKQRHWSTY